MKKTTVSTQPCMRIWCIYSIFVFGFIAVGGCKRAAAPTTPTSQWVGTGQLFVPNGAEGAECKLEIGDTATPSGKPSFIMSSEKPTRFGMFFSGYAIDVIEGEVLRLSAWVKTSDSVVLETGKPGVFLRATLLMENEVDYPGGHFHVAEQGVFMKLEDLPPGHLYPEWTKVSAVVKTPKHVKKVKMLVFCSGTSGKVLVDSPIIEKVAPETPITAVRGN